VRRSILSVSLVAVLATAGLAQAAPRTSDGSLAPPDSDTFTAERTECAAGATCTATRSVDEAGQVLATSDYSRAVATTGKEAQLFCGGVRFRHRTAPSTKQVTASFTWLVTAAARAEGRSGDVFSRVWLATYDGGCGHGCTVTTDEYVVVDALERAGLPHVPGDDDHPTGFPKAVKDQRVVVTLTYSGRIPTWLTGGTEAITAAAGYPMNSCLVDGLPTCGVDSGHAGSAHAEVDARLLSVSFAES
jgi:hypothetical protein